MIRCFDNGRLVRCHWHAVAAWSAAATRWQVLALMRQAISAHQNWKHIESQHQNGEPRNGMKQQQKRSRGSLSIVVMQHHGLYRCFSSE